MTNQFHRMTAEKILEYVDAEVESGRRTDIGTLAWLIRGTVDDICSACFIP
ncbi:hypothetical protein [Escherichia sp. E3659]|uniref:hypothetical protein n=1 Tax=Escherichia sp. E3659 TaxID=2044462 RepID=UPI001F0FC31C|nr:hypothetical protein [Escherichia sp. E3659]